MFDPHQEYLEPPLQGYRLAGDGYEPIPAAPDGSLESRELGLQLQIEGRHVRFVRLDTGARLLTRGERAKSEAQARRARRRPARLPRPRWPASARNWPASAPRPTDARHFERGEGRQSLKFA